MRGKVSFVSGISTFVDLEQRDRAWVVEALREKPRRPRAVLEATLTAAVARVLANTIEQPRVFLSHSHEDRRFVRGLWSKLGKSGIKVWVDEAEIKVGESLIKKLSEAIGSVDFLVVVLSRSSVRSEWVQREVELAINQEILSRGVKVLPILKDRVPLPGFLTGKLYIDFSVRSNRASAAKKLIEHILRYDRPVIRKRSSTAAKGAARRS
jgi:predicted nucleotide-binding protein